MSNLISAVSWVRRGVAAEHPTPYVLDEKELERVSALARIELDDAKKELERAQKAAESMAKRAETEEVVEGDEDDEDEDEWVDEDEGNEKQEESPSKGDDAMDEDEPMDTDPAPSTESNGTSKLSTDDGLAKYRLDEYDAEEDAPALGPFSNIKGLTYYRNNEEDPYITLKEDEEDNEREELQIYPTDNLIVAAKTEDEISQLEVYVYNEAEEDLYVHHDLMLPSFPLCLEWLNFPPASSPHAKGPDGQRKQFGNYIAVGTLDPEIEIWSLDVVEAMYPDMVLGRPDKTAAHIPAPLGTGKKKRKKAKHREVSDAHHVDAVLSLSWNKTHRNMLASASADRTVKLWDLSRDPTISEEGGEGALRSFSIHKDKVQSVQWNEREPTVLLTGSYDRTVRTFDSRAPDTGVGAIVGADVEALRWDPWDPTGFYVSLENGIVLNFDARTLPTNASTPSPARFTLSAHDGAVSALDINPHIPGCIATGGTDKMVKIWNITEDADLNKRQVSLVTSRDLGVGKVFSVAWSPDDPLSLAAAGSKAKLQVWEVNANANARKALSLKLAAAGRTVKEKQTGGVISVATDDEDSSGGEGGDE